MKNLPLSLTLAAFSGAFTLLRPADWSPGVRRAYVLGSGAVVGAISVAAVRTGTQKAVKEQAGPGSVDLAAPETDGADGGTAGPVSAAASSSAAAPAAGPGARTPIVALVGMAAAVGATMSSFVALTLVLDKGIEAWLVRRGVAHPRRVMAVAAVVSSLTLDQMADLKDAKESAAR